jgi:L-threonylcarbamoyladenylate synthase
VNDTQIIDASDPAEQKKVVELAVALLDAVELVALPTETVYGLGADALNADAVAKIFTAKERPEFDPLIVHVGSFEQVAEVADIPEDLEVVVQKLMKAFWPGPLTIILPKKECVPDIVTSGMPTVAVRMSAHPVMKAVVRSLGRPVAAPSANRFGRISPTSASAVEQELGGRIPMIIDAGACREGLESTIVRPEAGESRRRPWEAGLGLVDGDRAGKRDGSPRRSHGFRDLGGLQRLRVRRLLRLEQPQQADGDVLHDG